MNDAEPPARFSPVRAATLGGALLFVVLGTALVPRLLSPGEQRSRNPAANPAVTRPIVQIVRQQPGLPDVADLVDRLCPSVAIIVAKGSDPGRRPNAASQAAASAYSTDGWLVTSASSLPPKPLDAVFGDGRRANVTDQRTDPVSGLAILKVDISIAPLTFSDQAFPRVGQFGLVLATPTASGCSAAAAMIGSDFLADGGSAAAYVRLRPAPDDWTPGTPLLGSDGRVVGIGTGGDAGTAIPAPIASVIIDELIRNTLSASTNFGFRAIDFAAPFSSRLGDVRSGAGIALVQAGSSAEKAGLQAGDIITAVDDSPVSSASELSRVLDAAGKKVKLSIQRPSEQIEVTLTRNPDS